MALSGSLEGVWDVEGVHGPGYLSLGSPQQSLAEQPYILLLMSEALHMCLEWVSEATQ